MIVSLLHIYIYNGVPISQSHWYGARIELRQ
jgi:hypothetical protein